MHVHLVFAGSGGGAPIEIVRQDIEQQQPPSYYEDASASARFDKDIIHAATVIDDALINPHDLVLHDELIHNSVLQGIQLSGALHSRCGYLDGSLQRLQHNSHYFLRQAQARLRFFISSEHTEEQIDVAIEACKRPL